MIKNKEQLIQILEEYPYPASAYNIPEYIPIIESLLPFEVIHHNKSVVELHNKEDILILCKHPPYEKDYLEFGGKYSVNYKNLKDVISLYYTNKTLEWVKSLPDLETEEGLKFCNPVYSKNSLSLQGKKYANIRNRVNYFNKNQDILLQHRKITELTKQELVEIIDLKKMWIKQHDDRVNNGEIYDSLIGSTDNITEQSSIAFLIDKIDDIDNHTAYIHTIHYKGKLVAVSLTDKLNSKFVYTPDRVVDMNYFKELNDLANYLQLKEIEFWETIQPNSYYLSGSTPIVMSLLDIKMKIPYDFLII